jgi:hypothetical protein
MGPAMDRLPAIKKGNAPEYIDVVLNIGQIRFFIN